MWTAQPVYCIALTSQRATTIRCHSYLRLEPLFQTHLLATTEDLTLRVYANANVAFIRHIPFGKASQNTTELAVLTLPSVWLVSKYYWRSLTTLLVLEKKYLCRECCECLKLLCVTMINLLYTERLMLLLSVDLDAHVESHQLYEYDWACLNKLGTRPLIIILCFWDRALTLRTDPVSQQGYLSHYVFVVIENALAW